jgi:hypothetical protein
MAGSAPQLAHNTAASAVAALQLLLSTMLLLAQPK